MKKNLLIKIIIKDILLFIRSRRFKGDKVNCPVCGFWASKFGLSPNGERENVRCPRCNSLERHRAQWLFGLSNIITLKSSDEKRILCFSHDFCYSRLFLKNYKYYFTAEYVKNSYSDYIVDIQNTGIEDCSFDFIVCNHILEHVEDDRKAISEIYRLLKPNGVAFLQVPMDDKLDKTIEDPSITDPEERRKLFGQTDHLRMYGWDISERLSDCGFEVDTIRFWEKTDPVEIEKYSIKEKEPVFICRKII